MIMTTMAIMIMTTLAKITMIILANGHGVHDNIGNDDDDDICTDDDDDNLKGEVHGVANLEVWVPLTRHNWPVQLQIVIISIIDIVNPNSLIIRMLSSLLPSIMKQ